MIRAGNLGYTFSSGRVGVAAVDIDIEPGELVALLGPNGSGKTTLLRLFAGDLEPTAGNLFVNAQRVGFAGAQPIHFDELTGRENARFFARAHGASDDAVEQHFAAFDLTADADVPAGEYSFGMQRKLVLTEALAPAPQLLLLDEPTIGLDPAALHVLRIALQDHARAGNAVVFGTNDVRVAVDATRIVFLHRGRKVADATPAELLSRVKGRTRIDITLSTPPTREPLFPGGVTASGAGDGFSLETTDGAVLPDVCAALQSAGARIHTVRTREPDLGDVFLQLTGEALSRDAVA